MIIVLAVTALIIVVFLLALALITPWLAEFQFSSMSIVTTYQRYWDWVEARCKR